MQLPDYLIPLQLMEKHNNYSINIPLSLNNYQDLQLFLYKKGIYQETYYGSPEFPEPEGDGDDVVHLTSQIGWSPVFPVSQDVKTKVVMKDIQLFVDTNGGNSMWNHLHGKMTHRKAIMDRVLFYLTK